MFGEWGVSRPLTAAGGAALLFGLVMLLASSGRAGATAMKITLCGVALSAFASAVAASILILDEQTLQAMRTWLAGDLSGVSMHTLRVATLPALLCGASVSIAGPIGFIGLVVPHAIRRWAGQDIRIGLLLALPTGALLLLLADILARWLLAPQELATGVMTALVGAPIFIVIAVRFFK